MDILRISLVNLPVQYSNPLTKVIKQKKLGSCKAITCSSSFSYFNGDIECTNFIVFYDKNISEEQIILLKAQKDIPVILITEQSNFEMERTAKSNNIDLIINESDPELITLVYDFISQYQVYQSQHVLVVDDSRVDSCIITTNLSEDFLQNDNEQNPDNVIDILSNSESINIVILDYEMPNKNGCQLMREIKATFPTRDFKLIDRTFNLNIKTTMQIMQFFLDRMTDDLYLHFEVVPDHLPRKLKELLALFPEGSLQFEIGIQTFNTEVQANINRKQNSAKSKDNLLWLRDNTRAHIHADLIFGLPGETFETFKDSFNQLYHCRPHEIQMGILKRLKGSPIIRHTEAFDLRFNPLPPFNILSTDRISFTTMQRINRFARYWDMIGNSGRFKYSLPHILSDEPFDDFMAITEWIFNKTGQIHKINLKKLFELVSQSVEALFPDKHQFVITKIELDYDASKLKSLFNGLKLYAAENTEATSKNKSLQRQQRHMS